MKGQKVKEILQFNGFILKEVAESMGETPQNFQAMLKVEDIKTGVLERIAKSINKNITFFFNEYTTNGEEIGVVNEILNGKKQINRLYQSIINISELLNEYFNFNSKEYLADARIIIDNVLSYSRLETDIRSENWREFELYDKKMYLMEIKEALKNLTDIFYDLYNILHKEIKGNH